MIVRLVKMTFHEEKLDDFFRLFGEVRDKIAASSGCLMLKAYSDVTDKTVIFTYSEWLSEQDLNQYRNSALFKSTWSETKKLFKAPPIAWSMSELS